MRLIVTYATLARPSVTPVSAWRRCWRGRIGLTDDEFNDSERRERSPWLSAWSSDPTHADKASAGCWSLLPNQWATGRGYTQVRFATGDDAVDFYRSCGWADEESLTLASTGMTTII